MHRKPAINDRMHREKLRRTDEILQAAKKVMLTKSYAGATMDDIASEAGISKPTIYQYFKTKDQLFVDLVEPLILSLATQLNRIKDDIEADKYESGSRIVHDIYNVYYDTFEKDPDIFKLFNIFLQVGMNRDMNSEARDKINNVGKMCFIAGNSIVIASSKKGFLKDLYIYHTKDFVWGSFWGIVQVEQNKWGKEGISPFLKPVLQYTESLLINALVKK